MFSRLITVLLFTLFFSEAASGQKLWTLQECIEYARANNINIKQAALSSELARVSRDQSYTTMLPTVNGSSSHQRSFGRSVDPFTNSITENETRTTNFSVSSNVTLFGGLRLQHSLAQSKYEYLQSQENLAKINNDISLNVAAAYLQVLFSMESLKLARDRVNAATETRNRTAKMVETGMMAQGNLLDAEAALASEELALVTAENSLNSANIAISQLLELDNASDFIIATQQVEIPSQSTVMMKPEEIYAASLKTLPEIRASEYGISGAKKGLSSAKSSLFPSLNLFSSIGTFYNEGGYTQLLGETPFDEQVRNNQSKNVGISLSIPLFNGWSVQSNIKRSRLNLENAMLQDELTRKQVYKSVVQAHADATAAMNRYNASTKAKSSADEAFNYAQRKYDVGLISFIEFINIRNNKSRAESELIQSKYDFIFRLKVLDFYLGKNLSF
ncbi:MAG: TolC family protein [Bacteroidota bacterium]